MEPLEIILRNSAEKLSDIDPQLPQFAELAVRDKDTKSVNLFGLDPATAISLGGLLVNIISLAWKIYLDIKKNNENAKIDKEAFTRKVRTEYTEETTVSEDTRNRVIRVVVEEIVNQDK